MYKVPSVSVVLKDFEGNPIKGPGGKELTLKTVLTNQLGSYQGQGVTGDQLIKAYDLGIKIHNAAEGVDLEDEQMTFLKLILEKNPIFTAVVMGQVLNILNGSKVEAEKPTPPAPAVT